MAEEKKCGCGKTKNSQGNCDGSHAVKTESKPTPYNQITIRCISTKGEPQRVRMRYPAVANNHQLMRTMGYTISDPQYDAKMEAFKAKQPWSENGQAKLPVQESFAPKIEPVKIEPKIEQPKNEILPKMELINSIPAPSRIHGGLIGEKVKRTRRTKAQMQADKLTKKQTA